MSKMNSETDGSSSKIRNTQKETNEKVTSTENDTDDRSITDTSYNCRTRLSASLPSIGWGYRHQQCCIYFVALIVTFIIRASMGIALVAMTKIKEENVTNITKTNATDEIKTSGILNILLLVPPYPVLNWDKKVQDFVLSSFYWGYMLLQIPGAQLVHKFGARFMITLSFGTNAVLLLILPIATVYGGPYCTAICRTLQGLSLACVAIGLLTCLGKWVPLHERGRLVAFVYGAQPAGTVLGIPLTGFIAASPMGWPGIFRLYGILAAAMATIIFFFMAEKPAEHPKISFREKRYIEDDLGTVAIKTYPVPWRQILCHKGVYATIISQIGHTWGHLILYSQVPAYMDKVMGIDIRANGLLTALPFLIMWFTSFFFNWLTDWIVVKKIMSVTNSRRFANSLGAIPATIGLIALAYAPSNIYVIEAILIIICAFKISIYCGFAISQVDIAPNFSGILLSLSNFVANIGASIAPLTVGFILTDVTDKYLWRQVFFVTAGLYFITNLLFVLMATSDRAEWNQPATTSQANDDEERPMMTRTTEKKDNV